jgi:hypothetical protein
MSAFIDPQMPNIDAITGIAPDAGTRQIRFADRLVAETMPSPQEQPSVLSSMFLPPFFEFFLNPEILEQSALYAISYVPLLLGFWLGMKGITPGMSGPKLKGVLEGQEAKNMINDPQARPAATFATPLMKGAFYLAAGFAALQVMQGHYLFENFVTPNHDEGPLPFIGMAGMGLIALWTQIGLAYAGFGADKIHARLAGTQQEFSPEYHKVAKALAPERFTMSENDWKSLTQKNLSELSLVVDKYVLQALNPKLNTEKRVKLIVELRQFARLFGTVDPKPLLAKTLPLCRDDHEEIRNAAIELHQHALSAIRADMRQETLRQIYIEPLSEFTIPDVPRIGKKSGKRDTPLKRRTATVIQNTRAWWSRRKTSLLNRHIQLIVAILPYLKLEEAEDVLRAVYAAKPGLKADAAFTAIVLGKLAADVRDGINLESLKIASAFGTGDPIRFDSVKKQTTDTAKFTTLLNELGKFPSHVLVAQVMQPFKAVLRQFTPAYRMLAIVRFADWAAAHGDYEFGAVLADLHDEFAEISQNPKRQLDHDTGRLAEIGDLIRFREATLDEIGYFDPSKAKVVDPGFVTTDTFNAFCAYNPAEAVRYLSYAITVMTHFSKDHDGQRKTDFAENLIRLKRGGTWQELAESDPDAMKEFENNLSRLLRSDPALAEVAERFETARPDRTSPQTSSVETPAAAGEDAADRLRRATLAQAAAQRRPA